MAKKWTVKKFATLVILVFTAVLPLGLSGCGTMEVGMNPYELLVKIDAVDHTRFFYEAYDAFIGAGLDTVAAQAEEQLNNSSEN